MNYIQTLSNLLHNYEQYRSNLLFILFSAGLLAILSLLHIASSALGRRISCQSSSGTDSVGESLLNARPENYDRFEEVLVSGFEKKHVKPKKAK